jgi:hypothetical protein
VSLTAYLRKVERLPLNVRVFVISALAGPIVFAFLYCLNAAILIWFFDPRSDRPMYEYLVALTVYQFFFFILEFFASLPAFVALGAWLTVLVLLLKKVMVRKYALVAAAVVFSPLVIFISSKISGRFELTEEDQIAPPLIFGSALLWEFPLRGFLMIALFDIVAVLVCCLLVLRRSDANNFHVIEGA